jgi:hypothetical protein
MAEVFHFLGALAVTAATLAGGFLLLMGASRMSR